MQSKAPARMTRTNVQGKGVDFHRRRGKFLKDILDSELQLLLEAGAQKTRQVLERDAGLRTAVAAGGRLEDAASS